MDYMSSSNHSALNVFEKMSMETEITSNGNRNSRQTVFFQGAAGFIQLIL